MKTFLNNQVTQQLSRKLPGFVPLFLGCLILPLCGCRVITFQQTAPTGATTRVSVWQAFTATGSYQCAITPTGATLTATKSGVDGKALGTAAGTAGKILLTP